MGLKRKSFLSFCPRYNETGRFRFFEKFDRFQIGSDDACLFWTPLIAFSGGRVYTSVDPCVAGMMPEAIIDE
jgi:hypothetical protein